MNTIDHDNAPRRRPTASGRSAIGRLATGWTLVALLTMVLTTAHAPPATAAIWTEVGDAGPLPATAQAVIPNESLTSISGTLSPVTDADMYLIFIDGGGTFSATTVGQPGTLFDSQLFLFDSTGRGVYANDDDGSAGGIGEFRSTLPANHALTPRTPGLYYLVITNSGVYPTSAPAVLIFPNINTGPTFQTAVVGPTGPGGGSPITGYSLTTAAGIGTYTIALTGASGIPAPASLVILLTATPCLFLYEYWRRKSTTRRQAPTSLIA